MAEVVKNVIHQFATLSTCLGLLLLQFPLSANAAAQGIVVETLKTDVIQRELNIECKVQFAVDEKIKTALSNGIAINFLVEFELQQQIETWLDKKIAHVEKEFHLKYHALSNQFVVEEFSNPNERSFPDLYSAFFYMGHLQNIKLVNLDTLELDGQYYIQARARLATEKLPLLFLVMA